MKARRPTSAEIALWQAATRDVQRTRPVLLKPEIVPLPVPVVAAEVAVLPLAPIPQRALPVPNAIPPFDTNIERRILKGQVRFGARLDLHGMTEAVAYAALSQFIIRSASLRHRLVLVVTGKGVMGEGVLKRNLPRWLDSPPLAGFVSSIRPAYDRHGGEGAFYVLLRKRRPG